MNEQIFQQALLNVQARRLNAKNENERRFREISQKIPEIREIQSQMALTATRIFELIQKGEAIESRLESMRQENLEAQAMIAQLLKANGYPADYLELHYHCPKCDDTGYSNGKYCECLEREIAAAAIRKMNESAQLKLATFDQFSLEYYRGRATDQGEDCFKTMQSILMTCQDYALHFTKDSPSLLFYGSTGLGKTHLSLAIAHEVMTKGYEVIYDSIINLLEQVEREHFGRGKDTNTDTLELLLSVDLLILDDLGTEFTSSFYVSAIYNIINTRLNRGLPTIISTNLEYQDILKRYDERLISRLFAVYETLHFVGDDIRLIKKLQGGNRV